MKSMHGAIWKVYLVLCWTVYLLRKWKDVVDTWKMKIKLEVLSDGNWCKNLKLLATQLKGFDVIFYEWLLNERDEN